MPKQPRAVLDGIFAFPPNRETLGGTAYLIVENNANLLVDCPAWDETNQQFLQDMGGVRWLFITHRGAIAKVKEIQLATQCEIVIQEQIAYLLPGLTVTAFGSDRPLNSLYHGIWTPGHCPGSACLYYPPHGGVLFSGRHLLPNPQGNPAPLRTKKTFHWLRQIRSTTVLLERFSPDTLAYICPGANTGFLRGKRAIENAYQGLSQLDLDVCLQQQPPL
jgi:glyoxylase-like metal-dependent hydrolase (beta-lactamase superfamily II)